MMIVDLILMLSCMMILMEGHPLIMVISIMLSTCLVTKSIFSIISTPWFSYILILAFLGGLLVIFVYISSLIPNEMMLSNKKKMFSFCLMALFIMTIYTSNLTNMTKISMFYSHIWTMLMFMIAIILISMVFISIMSYNPFTPLKSK